MQIAQNWRLKNQRYALKGTQCQHCNKAIFPPREVCPYCEAKTPTLYEVKRESLNLGANNTPLQRAAR
ncbi:MAG: zinc ribbon domain-containing protein [Chloroflexota bacterium]